MKKMIRDRVVFIVISCIALAGMIYWCNATAPAVTLKTEYHAALGTQAAVSFSNFFEEVQDWYDSYPAGENFTMTYDEDVPGMVDLLAGADVYWLSMDALADTKLQAEIGTYSAPMITFAINIPLSLLSLLETYGTYEVDADIWALVEQDINTMIAYYQNYQN